jgi:hypothetical protein
MSANDHLCPAPPAGLRRVTAAAFIPDPRDSLQPFQDLAAAVALPQVGQLLLPESR